MSDDYRRLCAAVILQAIADLRDAAPAVRRDAEAFFRSRWYLLLCDAVGVRPARSLKELRRASVELIGRSKKRPRCEDADAGH